MSKPSLDYFDQLLSEQHVVERYSSFIGLRELRGARRNGEIAFVRGKRGAVFYHPDDLAEFLSRLLVLAAPSAGAVRQMLSERALSQTRHAEEAERLLEKHLEDKFLRKSIKPGRG